MDKTKTQIDKIEAKIQKLIAKKALVASKVITKSAKKQVLLDLRTTIKFAYKHKTTGTEFLEAVRTMVEKIEANYLEGKYF